MIRLMVDGKLIVCQEYKELTAEQPTVVLQTFDDNATQGSVRRLAALKLPVYRVMMPCGFRRGISGVSAAVEAVYFAEWTDKLYAVEPVEHRDYDFLVTLAGLNVRTETAEMQQKAGELLTVAWLKSAYSYDAYAITQTLASVRVVVQGLERTLIHEPIPR